MNYYVHPKIAQALQLLAGVCDGAHERDGAGFSAADQIGRQWGICIANGGVISPADQERAMCFLPTYHRQLKGHVELPSAEEFNDYLEVARDLWHEDGDAIQEAIAQAERKARESQYAHVRKLLEAIREKMPRWISIAPSTHPSVIESLLLLEQMGELKGSDFYANLLSRINTGDLSPRQQIAFLKTIDQYSDILSAAGVQTGIIAADIEEYANRAYTTKSTAPVRPVGTVKLKGRDKVAVSFGYNPDWVAKIKQLLLDHRLAPGKHWKNESREWLIPLELLKKLSEVLPQLQVEPEALSAFEEWKDDHEADSVIRAVELQKLIELAELDGTFERGDGETFTLRDYQKQDIARALSLTEATDLRGPIIGHDMGLGKTIQSLTFARAYQRRDRCKVFVICPATLKKNWLREAAMAQVEIEVFSWAKIPDPLETQNYVAIFDEAHYAQSGERSNRGKRFLALSQHPNCIAVVPMSGTPMKNGAPINLLPLLQAIDHPAARNPWQYKTRFCGAHKKSIGYGREVWDFTGAAHLDELATEISDAMIRRKKKEVLHELPEKTRVFVPVTVEGDRLRDWKAAVQEASDQYEELVEIQRQTGQNMGAALVLMGKLRQAASTAKVPSTIEMAMEVLEQGDQPIIFTEFLSSAEELVEYFREENIPFEFLHGGVKNDDRQPMVDRFQSGRSKVFVSTTKAGGVGLTLTRSTTVILVDRPWTPGDAVQCEDRAHRIGQLGNVTCLWPQWSAIDEKVDQILAAKQERIDLVMDGKRKTLRGVKNPNDIVFELLDEVLGRKKEKAA